MAGQKIELDPPYFDEEERETIEAFHEALDQGTLLSTLTPERKAELQAIARATIVERDEEVTARLSRQDLSRLKKRALETGISDQTLLASIIHRYFKGDLIDRSRPSDRNRPRVLISGSRAWSNVAARQRRLHRSGHAANG